MSPRETSLLGMTGSRGNILDAMMEMIESYHVRLLKKIGFLLWLAFYHRLYCFELRWESRY
jgi:hypothetical protein